MAGCRRLLAGYDAASGDFLPAADVDVTTTGTFDGDDVPEYALRARNRAGRPVAVGVVLRVERAAQVAGEAYGYVPDLAPGASAETRVAVVGYDGSAATISCERPSVSVGDGTMATRNRPLGRSCR